jgi:hypothetical protein
MFSVVKSLNWVCLRLIAFAGPSPDEALQARAAERPIEGFKDNSFFSEELCGQEPGVVQHNLTDFGKVNCLFCSDVFFYLSFRARFFKAGLVR